MQTEYMKHQLSNTINVHKVVILNYFEFENNFQYKGERHNFWELVYVDEGKLLIQANEGTFPVVKGECVFHKPNEFHVHKADGVVAPRYFVIGFVCNSSHMQSFRGKQFKLTPQLRALLLAILGESKKVFDLPFNKPEDQRLKTVPDELFGGQQMIKTYLEQFLILLLRQEYHVSVPKLPDRMTKEELLADQMKKKLNMSIYQHISVEQFCKELNYSKAYLSRIFSKEVGCTIRTYITQCKIEEAKLLIREHTYNFTQISDMLCFSNPLYFSRVFHKITGMSPSEYKNTEKQK